MDCFTFPERPRINNNDTLIGTPLLISEFGSIGECGKMVNNETSYRKHNDMKLFLLEYNQMSQKQRFERGHQTRDLLKDCFYEGKTCSKSHFGFFQNFRYGNCIAFNRRSEEPLLISRTGPDSGLTLNLKLESIYYLPTSETYGAKVVIHHPDEIPNPEEAGFAVSPGYETSIALKETDVHRLPAPYKDECLHYKGEDSVSFKRSKNSCIRACIQKQNFEECGCVDPTLSVLEDLKPCSLINETEVCCLNEVLNTMSLSRSTCGCPLPCLSVQYNGVLSRSKLREETLFLDINRCKDIDPFRDYKEENVRLKIFYSSLQIRVYQQLPRWEDWSFLSFIGNELALWLGISMAAVFQVFEKMTLFLKKIYLKHQLSH
ncbi:degenerin mec-10-like [Argiope bruennichi]|nr:degenerin mec-10-like [Argiope bruennichi]